MPTKRPWKCRFGFHRWVDQDRLITMSTARCERCGDRLIVSMFGDFIERGDAP